MRFIHRLDIAHQDIKLENILLDDYFNIKLADFGSAIDLAKTEGLSSKAIGTPAYMAPEVATLAKGEHFDARQADVYSLGMTLLVLLVGEFPDTSDEHRFLQTVGTDDTSLCSNFLFGNEV